MSLREDINIGLKAISNPNSTNKLELDKDDNCFISIPLPPSVVKLADDKLMISVKISPSESFFSLLSPLAIIKKTLSAEFLEALFYRQFYAEQVSGVSLSINAEQMTLVAVYHWMLDSITPDDFRLLFKKFISAVLELIDEINDMAQCEKNIKPIHKGHSK